MVISWAQRHPVTLLVATAAAVAGLAATQRSFVDLAVYQYGGRTVLDGLPLYTSGAPGSGLLFTYPPFAALVMTVLAAAPAWLAVAVWTALGVAALGVTLWAFAREAGSVPRAAWVATACAGALLLDPVRARP